MSAHVSFWKEPLGTYERERKQASRARSADERQQKALARKRDRGCRWPHCPCRLLKLRVEVAHIHSKSLGGSNALDNLIVLCASRHRGRPSLHSGELRVVPQTPAGASGPCDFEEMDERGRWSVVGRERYVGESVTRS